MRRALSLSLLLASCPTALATEPATLPEPAQLTAEIQARDLELFDVMFEQCAPEKLRALVTDDLEFYHDKGGLMRGGDAFVAQYAKNCEAAKKPDAWRSRRKVVEGSFDVDPVPGHGAIATGEHRFYERQGEGAEKLVGRARFAIVWQRTADGWRMSRALSYDHGPASE